MSRHTFVSQPEKFRSDADAADWAWFPHLRLVLGWGDGIWQTVSKRLIGVRHVFFLIGGSPPKPPIEGLLDNRQRHFDYSPLQGIEPPLVVEGASSAVTVRYRLNDVSRAEACPTRCPGGTHVIVPDGEYAVRHVITDAGMTFTLCRRERALKPEFHAKLSELGLRYESGVGKRDARPDGMRTPQEQKFAEWASQYKRSYIERRTVSLGKDPSLRPPDFEALRAAHIRARAAAIQRGKHDSKGMPHRPHNEEDLLRLTCGEVARREAAELMFDAHWREVAVLSSIGFSPLGT